MSLKQTKKLLGNLVGNCNEVLVDWRNYIRQVCLRALEDTETIGGLGTIVQIDESLMRGRRKNNVGRILCGNRFQPASQNYGRTIVGPWIFGVACRRPDGKQELRMFQVLRRNESTLKPIVQRHIAPGSEIWSDEWTAYVNIPKWHHQGQLRYIHRIVNHSQNFVNPITGVNTQRIEANWGWIRTKIVRVMRGTKENLPLVILQKFSGNNFIKIHHF